MHPALEAYLKRINSQLRGFPTAERRQQIHEISQHLEALIEEKMAMGLAETEAVQATLRDFGNPRKIGRDLRMSTGGTKTGVLVGMGMGAILGMTIMVFLWILPVFMGLYPGTLTLLGSLPEHLLQVSIGGAAASLIGRRFTRRYLIRSSSVLTVCLRLSLLGAIRGMVGGAIYGALNRLWFSYDSDVLFKIQFPALAERDHWYLFQELFNRNIAFHAMEGAIFGAFMVGVGGALVGLWLSRGEHSSREISHV